MILSLLYRKDTRIFLDFFHLSARTITEWNKLPKETVTSQSLLGYLLLGVNIRFFISFICSFSFY